MTRHRFDLFSFVVGAASVGLAVLVLTRPGQLAVEDLRLAGPLILLALGLAALVTATTRTPRAVPTSQDIADREPHPGDTAVLDAQEGTWSDTPAIAADDPDDPEDHRDA